jgi:hypothetical protein
VPAHISVAYCGLVFLRLIPVGLCFSEPCWSAENHFSGMELLGEEPWQGVSHLEYQSQPPGHAISSIAACLHPPDAVRWLSSFMIALFQYLAARDPLPSGQLPEAFRSVCASDPSNSKSSGTVSLTPPTDNLTRPVPLKSAHDCLRCTHLPRPPTGPGYALIHYRLVFWAGQREGSRANTITANNHELEDTNAFPSHL